MVTCNMDENIYTNWQQSYAEPQDGIRPTVFPTMRSGGTYPVAPAGQLGYHMHDQLAPIYEHTFEAAVESANVAAAAAQAVLHGEQAAYALCRPSGHHAGYDNTGGATYLNNAGVAAQILLNAHSRILIVDVDVHHGNGTQDIFYDRDDVFFISLHRDPSDYHPYHWGYATERGAGVGEGFNLNLPLRAGATDEVFLGALKEGLAKALETKPTAWSCHSGLTLTKTIRAKGFLSAHRRFMMPHGCLRL